VLSLTDAIDADGGRNSPAYGVHRDKFSVRWAGTVTATRSGIPMFQTEPDDGVRGG